MSNDAEFFALQARAHALTKDASEAFWASRYTELKASYVDTLISEESPESFKAMVANTSRQIAAFTRDEPLTACGKFFVNYKHIDFVINDICTLCRASCLASMGPLGQSILERALAKFET